VQRRAEKFMQEHARAGNVEHVFGPSPPAFIDAIRATPGEQRFGRTRWVTKRCDRIAELGPREYPPTSR